MMGEWRRCGFEEALCCLHRIRCQLMENGGADEPLPGECSASLTGSVKLHVEAATENGGEGPLFSLVEVLGADVTPALWDSMTHLRAFELSAGDDALLLFHGYKLLGRGGHSEVYRGVLSVAMCGVAEQSVALKTVHVQVNNATVVDRWIRVLRLWQAVSHPCLVHCHYVGLSAMECTRKGTVCIYAALEMAAGGTLDALLKEKGRLTEDVIRAVLSDLLHALCYLHDTVCAVHNDIKPHNILLVTDDDTGRVRYKLSDLDAVYPAAPTQASAGSGVLGEPGEQKLGRDEDVCGTPPYMSPESCCGLPFFPANDIWSVGIVTYQLSTGRLPWTPLELQVPSMILHGHRRASSCHFGPTLDEFGQDTAHLYSGELRDMVRVCLAERASDRPSASALLQHPFFSSEQSL